MWSCFHVGMPYLLPEADPRIVDAVSTLGRAVRLAWLDLGLSQEALEALAGVDQTAISRLERGLAPHFPVGACPHDHPCRWRAEARSVRPW